MFPMHPGLVHYPIVLSDVSIVTDVCGKIFRRPTAYLFGRRILYVSTVASYLTAAAGFHDYFKAKLDSGTKKYVRLHMFTGISLVTSLTVMTCYRILRARRGRVDVDLPYFALAAGTLGLVYFQAWYGGELSYTLGAGVAPVGFGTETFHHGKKRIDKLLGRAVLPFSTSVEE